MKEGATQDNTAERGTYMKFEDTGLDGTHVDLNQLTHIMEQHSMVLAGQWDYERVTYDRKFELKEGVYYLRVFGFAVKGDIGAEDAVIELMTPLLGKHYYPHGVEYGDDEYFPESLVQTCEKLLADIKAETLHYV